MLIFYETCSIAVLIQGLSFSIFLYTFSLEFMDFIIQNVIHLDFLWFLLLNLIILFGIWISLACSRMVCKFLYFLLGFAFGHSSNLLIFLLIMSFLKFSKAVSLWVFFFILFWGGSIFIRWCRKVKYGWCCIYGIFH